MKLDAVLTNYYTSPYRKSSSDAKQLEKPTDPAGKKDDTSLHEISKKAQEIADKSNKENQVRLLERQQARIEAHEEAHQAMGGGGIVYTSIKGPDGNTYHIHGHVSIDTSDGATEAETVEKMGKVVAAAMAPANPSPADMGVATSATAKKAVAEHRIEEERTTLKSMDDKRTDGQKTRAIKIKVLGYTVSYYA